MGKSKEEKGEVKVKHPALGHVIFYNPTLREREILEDYIQVKKTLERVKPFIAANVKRFNHRGSMGNGYAKGGVLPNIKDSVSAFKKKYMGDNGVSTVTAHEENGEHCIKVAIMNLEKHRAKFPKQFLGHRLILVDFLVSK